MPEETQTTARLEARLPNDVHALLKRAAEIEGRMLTDFVVSAAREAACRTIEATEIIRLSVEDQRQIAEALLNPARAYPCPEESLSAAAGTARRVMTPPFRLEQLSGEHERFLFRCGEDALDRYFQTQVTQDVRRRIANCFVAVENVTDQ
jgi:uncharacterized protein (DUF1778 family)